MDEGNIFQANNSNLNNTPNASDLPIQNPTAPSVSQNPQVVNVPIEPAIQPNPAPPPAPPFPSDGSFLSNLSIGSILKILIGIGFIIFFLFLIFVVILPNFNKNKNQKVTLTYWGLWEDASVMNPIISDFERQNPNITVVYSKQDSKDYRDRLTARIQNGTGPDIFTFHNTWYPMLSGFLLPLPSSVISKDQFAKSFYPVASSDLIKNGGIYGIPLELDTLALYVNTDILNSAGIKPPTTWEQFRDDAKSLTVKDSSGKIQTAGAAIGTFDNVNHAPDILSLLFVQNGADLSNFTNSSQQVSDALKFYTSFSSDSSSVWDSTLDPSLLDFSKGSVAMVFGYSWDYFNIKALNPALNFQIVPVPQLDPTNPIAIASYWAQGASIKSPHQKEALMFLHYLTDSGVEQKIYSEEAKTRVFGEPYPSVTLAPTLKSDPNLSAFVSQNSHAVSSYFVDSTFDNGLNLKLNTYLGNAVTSIFNNTSPDSATATLFAGYGQVLKEYGQ